MITIHGRTRCQFYKGRADWARIGDVVRAVSMPVVANGDIVDAGSARRALSASGAAGVMVGRGVQGRPWLLRDIRDRLAGVAPPAPPAESAFAGMVGEHYEDTLSFYGTTLGSRVIRKHLGWYMDAAGTPTDLRRRILTGTPATVRQLLPEAFGARVAA